MTPAQSARRLLLGTGLGLLLAGGFGFVSGIISVNTFTAGYLVPFAGIVLITLSKSTGIGEGPLSKWFPNENDAAMASRVEFEITQQKRDDDIGNAWAKLEHSMLSKELVAEE